MIYSVYSTIGDWRVFQREKEKEERNTEHYKCEYLTRLRTLLTTSYAKNYKILLSIYVNFEFSKVKEKGKDYNINYEYRTNPI